MKPNVTIDIPTPSNEQVELYLQKWRSGDDNRKYRFQEDAINKLFYNLCPKNTEISEILLKVATLNDFYSTNIFSTYSVAERILSLNIDSRLEANDISLVADIQKVNINGNEKNFYSFATKYCSHHKPLEYPIYDSYVEKVLCYFQKRDNFASFYKKDLRHYAKFKEAVIKFIEHYNLTQYDLRQIDLYLWLLGKEHFSKKKKQDKENSKKQ